MPRCPARRLALRIVESLGIGGTIAVTLFAIGVVALLVLSARQGTRQRAELRRFAEGLGWRVAVSAEETAAIERALEAVDPSRRWTVSTAAIAADVADPRSLFAYWAQARRSDDSERGFGALAARTGGPESALVTIHPRVPVLAALLSDAIEVGSPAFRGTFVVQARAPATGARFVTAEVERILLDHVAVREWHMTARIAPSGVLLTSAWAATPDDWDHLLRAAAAIRAAIR